MKNLELPATGKQLGIELSGNLSGKSRVENTKNTAASSHQFSDLMRSAEGQETAPESDSHDIQPVIENHAGNENAAPAAHASVLDYLEADPGEEFLLAPGKQAESPVDAQVIDFNSFVNGRLQTAAEHSTARDTDLPDHEIDDSTIEIHAPIHAPLHAPIQDTTVQEAPVAEKVFSLQALEPFQKNAAATFPPTLAETESKPRLSHAVNPEFNKQEIHTTHLNIPDKQPQLKSALDTAGPATPGEILPHSGKLLPVFTIEPNLPGQQAIKTLYPEAQAMLIADIQAPTQETRQATTQASAVPVLQSSSPFGTGAWMEEFSGQIRWLGQAGIKHAEISLNPAELGSIEIKIISVDDQATVKFITASNTTREIIENSLPRLREMLASFGLDLGDTSVAQEKSTNQHDARQGQNIPTESTDNFESTTEHNLTSSGVAVSVAHEDGLVNIYI